MQIFSIYGKKKKRIFGKGIPLIDLPERIVDGLEIETGCNLFNVTTELAKIEIVTVKGSAYFACIKERKYVEIYCRSRKHRIMVARLDGDKENPKTLNTTIISTVVAFFREMTVICSTEHVILSQQAEEGIKC
jgi:hypothetical protein